MIWGSLQKEHIIKKGLIVIPSKGRPYKLKTINWLSKCELVDHDWRVFVEPDEYLYYKQSVGIDNLVVLEANNRGLGYALNFANKYAKNCGYEYQFHLDDDINGFLDSRVKTKYKVSVFEDIEKNILKYFKLEPKLGLIRFISAKGFYFYKDKKKDFIMKNQGAWGVLVTRVESFFVDPNWFAYQDTLLQLHLWDCGYYTKTYGLAGINVDVYKNDGGMQTRDRKKDSNDTVNYAKKKYPSIRLVESKNTLGYDIDISEYKPKVEYL